MTQPIPFSIELWQQGYRPVTRDGRLVEGLSEIFVRIWGENNINLLLLPPEDDVYSVTIEDTKCGKFISWNDKVPPGKYKLTKIE
jgi:hypothetical protein